MEDARAFQMKRAFKGKKINYPLDPKAPPANVHEYLHQVKEERESIFPACKKGGSKHLLMVSQDDVVQSRSNSIGAWMRREAHRFSDLALKLNAHRRDIQEGFPQTEQVSVENEREFCLFAMGSEIYCEIFPHEAAAQGNGHTPRSSIVVHFDQEELLLILNYFRDWIAKIGINNSIAQWMYAVLACLIKPLSDESEEFLEDLHDFLLKELRNHEEQQKKKMCYMIIGILANYFCVKAYKIGPSLDRFEPLC